jgi:biotin carboxyl carrier protein
MKFNLEVNGSPGTIELARDGSSCRFSLDSEPEKRVDVVQPEPGVYSVVMDGRSYEARVEHAPDMMIVVVSGHRYEIRVTDPRQWTRSGAVGAGSGRQHLTAPMPGRVVRILVGPGDEIVAGQGLLVVEAMKMQNEMKASRAGKVLSIPVGVGSTVSAGETLAVIE